MQVFDLFNNDHERRLAEGAVDQLEQRRIDDLNMKMDELANRVKSTSDPEHKKSLLKAFLKCKEERDSYYKVKTNEGSMKHQMHKDAERMSREQFCSTYGDEHGEFWDNIMGDLDEAGIPGNLPPEQVPGKEDLLKGKGRQTYEAVVTPPDAQQRAIEMGRGVYNELLKAWEEKKPYVMLPVPGGSLSLTRNQIFNVLLAVKNMKDPEYKKLLATTFNNADKFMVWLPTVMKYKIPPEKPEPAPAGIMPGGQVATQTSLPIKEAGQKKNSEKVDPEDLTGVTAQDAQVRRELQKVRARHPAARSDIEALIKDEIVNQERIDQQLAQQEKVDQEQNDQLAQVNQVNQQQSAKIGSLAKQVSTPVAKPAEPSPVAPTVSAEPTATKDTPSMPAPLYITAPQSMPEKDQEIYSRVKELEKELGQKIDAMASWNKVAQQDTGAQAELEALRKDVEGTKNRLASMQKKLNKYALPAPSEIDMGTAQQVRPGDTLRRGLGKEKDTIARTGDEMPLNIISQNDFDQLAASLTRSEEPANVREGKMGEIDAARQDLERMNERQFYTAYGMSKAAFQQKYRALLKPAEQQDAPVEEGWSDAIVAQRTGRPRTPYSVYIKGKKWKDFENEDHAENVANKLRAKFKQQGKDPSVITIAATDYDKDLDEVSVDTLKSYQAKRGAQVAAMKADNPNPTPGSKEWAQQAVPAQRVGRAGQKIARKERQQGVAEESYTKVMQDQGITDPKLLEVARKIDAFAKTIK